MTLVEAVKKARVVEWSIIAGVCNAEHSLFDVDVYGTFGVIMQISVAQEVGQHMDYGFLVP